MFLVVYLLPSLFAIINSVKVIPDTQLGLKDGYKGTESEVEMPLVTYRNRPTRYLLGSPINFAVNTFKSHTQPLGIDGGHHTNITQHPYQVAIDNVKSFVCAGALLNRIWVIALASCTAGAKPSDLTVRVGSNSNIYGGTLFNVSEIINHPKFNYTSEDYDFSLVKLSTYLCFDKTVSQIGFSQSSPKNNIMGTVSGWGKDGSKPSNTFRQLKMHTIPNNKCAQKYTVTRDTVTNRMFCAVHGQKGPCYGDFGDPFVVNGTLYGLYSWGRGCPTPDYPAVFSNLASVKDWIHTVMNNACTCGVY